MVVTAERAVTAHAVTTDRVRIRGIPQHLTDKTEEPAVKVVTVVRAVRLFLSVRAKRLR